MEHNNKYSSLKSALHVSGLYNGVGLRGLYLPMHMAVFGFLMDTLHDPRGQV